MSDREQDPLQRLCESLASLFEDVGISPEDLIETLPEARARLFARWCPAAVTTAE